jgi:phospholipid/cholesterol/gamma-HCH transport system substrate-binding protein
MKRVAAGIAVVLVASLVVALRAGGRPPTVLSADFQSAPGLFSGAPVQILGVDVGTVTKVTNIADHVNVRMQVGADHPVPAGVHATLVAPELLGEPSIELDPGYRGGPRLGPGATIPLSRTSVPVSLDRLLGELKSYLGALQPAGVGSLVANLAGILGGQGQRLNQLLSGAAGTLQLLASKGNDLGHLEASLAELTGALRTRTGAITSLVTDYDTVSGVIAANRGQLGDAITQLSAATDQLAGLVGSHLDPLRQDVATITTAGRTLDRNLGSIDQTLSSSPRLFLAARRAFDPTHNWLNLNNQLAPGTTAAYVEGLVRDRLAGVCRRVLAHHAGGLSPSQRSTLTSCGNPSSGYFDPILGLIPSVLNGLPGGGSLPSTNSAFAAGLARIPGLTPAQRSQVASSMPPTPAPTTTTTAPPSGTAPASPPPPSLLGPLPPLSGDQPWGGGLLGGLLGVIGP